MAIASVEEPRKAWQTSNPTIELTTVTLAVE
jgi:hypothetical protein